MASLFYGGLITGITIGILFKEHLNKIFNFIAFNCINTIYKIKWGVISKKNIQIIPDTSIYDIYFICKITNKDLFEEYFYTNNKLLSFPDWEFSKEKQTIKIKLDNKFTDFFYFSIYFGFITLY